MTPGDETTPNSARMYDYWLGGTDNYPADRAAADAVAARRPEIAEQSRSNKRFQTRAVTYVAGQGIAQFVDIGAGLPTSPPAARPGAGAGAAPGWRSTHEAARAVIPDAVVAYADQDPVAVAHARRLLAGGSARVVAVRGDARDPAAILADDDLRRAGFDPAAPACVLLCCLLHFLDAPAARAVVRGVAAALAPGSYVIISLGFAPGTAGDDFARVYNAQDGPRVYAHSWAQITALFDGLDLVPPGLADVVDWRPGGRAAAGAGPSTMIVGGVGRRP
jgi:SAM-dependent methyltransferase